jgi:PAS domain S-box-containing protein
MDESPIEENFGEEVCDMLFDIDIMGNITMVKFFNKALAAKLGYTEAELMGQNVTDFLLDSKSIAGAQHYGKLYASDTAFRSTSRILKMKNGEILTAESYLMPIHDEQGKTIGHRGMEFFKLESEA